MHRFRGWLAGVTLASLGAAQAGELALETVATGLSFPVWAGAPPGDDRIFVLEQEGRIRLYGDGVEKPQPFLDITAEVLIGAQTGLMGMAFHLLFADNGRFWVYYSVPSPDDVFGTPNPSKVRLEEYTVSSDPDIADPASATIVLEHAHANPIHKGGGPVLGPDGYLYVAIGEGGMGGPLAVDPCAVGRLDNWFGKLLRIDVDSGSPYAIPPDNPFVGTPGALPEIYHVGLRSPWRYSFDWQTGDMYLGDVGAFSYEEVHFTPLGVAGLNFGHPVLEGPDCDTICDLELPVCVDSVYAQPIHEYPNTGSSITGGFVYRGGAIPSLQGTYVFGDYVSSDIWSFRWVEGQGVTEFQSLNADLDPTGAAFLPTSFGEDGDGELLVVSYGGFPASGRVLRIVPEVVSTYCAAKTVSAGGMECTGVMHEPLGVASLSVATPLHVAAVRVLNRRTGLLFVGTAGPAALPFLGGTLCVAPPLARTSIQNSGGSLPPAIDCTGSFDIDLNGWLQDESGLLLVPGTALHAQYWYRVPEDPFETGLTNAVALELGP